jgi:predicted MFS family arabinose efflux permease
VSRYLCIAALVIAGEMIFGLPFHTARFFRPTLLEVFGLTNTQLGDLFAVYGIAAMASYFPGGALADRFSARALLTASLVATGCGGLYMATIPGAPQLALLYGFWGVTSIFLFWGALIRATREWGGDASQGAAFGILEAGRGLVAAVIAVSLVAVLSGYLPDDATLATDAERRAGMRAIILGYSATAFAAAALVWFVMPAADTVATSKRNPFANLALVLRRPVIWAQAAIIVCAYCCYKSLDYYSLYLVDVMGKDEVQGARLMSYGAYVRPVAALAAGVIADRFDATRSIGVIFIVLAVVYALLSLFVPGDVGLFAIFANLFVSLFAVFALRGIYFALLQETRTPRHITGAAVGMISVLGFTPEIFFAPIAGRILDATPGVGGYLDLFLFLALIAACGVGVVAWLLRLQRNISSNEAVS